MPFFGSNNKEIAMKILCKNVDLSHEKWNNITPQAKHIVRELLQRCPEQRMSIKDLKESDWVLRNKDKGRVLVPEIP